MNTAKYLRQTLISQIAKLNGEILSARRSYERIPELQKIVDELEAIMVEVDGADGDEDVGIEIKIAKHL